LTSAYYFVPTAELDRMPLRATVAPLPTVVTIMRDAFQGGRRGTPGWWRRSVLSGLQQRDATAVAPLVEPSAISYPSVLDRVDLGAPREAFDVSLDRLANTSGASVVEALENEDEVTPTTAWDAVRRDPDRWLRGYVDALHRGWPEIEPLWRRAAALLEWQEERVNAAMDNGVPPTIVLNELVPRAVIVDDAVRLSPADGAARTLSVDQDGLTIVPLVASAKAGTMSAPRGRVEWVGYSLPDAWRIFDGQAPPPASLHALLGAPRTAVLRSLDRPSTAGRLAERLGVARSVVSFHLNALEAAGLIGRERRGRNVIVRRTARGTHLLVLYQLP
jgi:DNA-binding transcriptional ArsR family regulator